ncbi:MAG: hypothetical protein IJ514_01255 [Clostridia bacterium]|nr:hypothetical protein [Clostridia bacterium]
MFKCKTIVTIILSAILSLFAFASCKDAAVSATVIEASETLLVVRVDETDGAATLLDAMNALQEEGEISFEIADGMITSVGGKANETDPSMTSGTSWMLYTSDAANANADYGKEYNGATYGSSNYGASQLIVVEDGYYIWAYEAWSF